MTAKPAPIAEKASPIPAKAAPMATKAALIIAGRLFPAAQNCLDQPSSDADIRPCASEKRFLPADAISGNRNREKQGTP
jgi:hypothetical protein